MTTQAQIEANRRNTLRSSGPRSVEGKAKSRFNALKSGIDSKALVIPGEDAAELEALAANYHQQYQPENPLEVFLVDAIVTADWELRRLRRIEAQLWARAMKEGAEMAEVFTTNPVLARLHRRRDAAERSMYRALKEMQRIRKPNKGAAEEDAAEGPAWELGSFLPRPNAGDPEVGEGGGASASGLPMPK
jgi:hypothetical protein